MSKMYELVVRRSWRNNVPFHLREIEIHKETPKQFEVGTNSFYKTRIRKESLQDLGFYTETSAINEKDFTIVILGEENIPNAINHALLKCKGFYEDTLKELDELQTKMDFLQDLYNYYEVTKHGEENNN